MNYPNNLKGITVPLIIGEQIFKNEELTGTFIKYLEKYFSSDKEEKEILKNFLFYTRFFRDERFFFPDNDEFKNIFEDENKNNYYNAQQKPYLQFSFSVFSLMKEYFSPFTEKEQKKKCAADIIKALMDRKHTEEFFKYITSFLKFLQEILKDKEFLKKYSRETNEKYFENEQIFKMHSVLNVYDMFLFYGLGALIAERAKNNINEYTFVKYISFYMNNFKDILQELKIPFESSNSFKFLFSENGIFSYMANNKDSLDEKEKLIKIPLLDFPEDSFFSSSLFYFKSVFGEPSVLIKKYVNGKDIKKTEYSVIEMFLKKYLYTNIADNSNYSEIIQAFKKYAKEKDIVPFLFNDELAKTEINIPDYENNAFVSTLYYSFIRRELMLNLMNQYKQNNVSDFKKKTFKYIKSCFNDERWLEIFLIVNKYTLNRKNFLEKDFNGLKEGGIEKFIINFLEYMNKLSLGSVSKKELKEYTEKLFSYKINEEDKKKILNNHEGFFYLLYTITGVFTEPVINSMKNKKIASYISKVATNFNKLNINIEGNFFNYMFVKNFLFNIATGFYFSSEKRGTAVIKSLYRLYKRFEKISFTAKDDNIEDKLASYYILGESIYFLGIKRLYTSTVFPDMLDKQEKISEKYSSLNIPIARIYYKDFINFFSKGFIHYDYEKLNTFLYLSIKKDAYKEFTPFELFIISGKYIFDLKARNNILNRKQRILVNSSIKINKNEIIYTTIDDESTDKECKKSKFITCKINFMKEKDNLENVRKYSLSLFFRGYIQAVLENIKEKIFSENSIDYKENLFNVFMNYGNENVKKSLIKDSLEFVKTYKQNLTKINISQKEIIKAIALNKTESIPFLGPVKNYFKEGDGVEEYLKKTAKDNAISAVRNFNDIFNYFKQNLVNKNIKKGIENGIEK